jgi:hypothetical protein
LAGFWDAPHEIKKPEERISRPNMKNTPNTTEDQLAKMFSRIFRHRRVEAPAVNPQPGPKIGIELNDFEDFLEEYKNRWRVGTQGKE